MQASILIVDDHQVFTDALRWRLGVEPDLQVVEVVGTGRGALEATERHHPDLVVLDVDLGEGTDVVDLLHELSSIHPEARVLVVTAHDDPTTAVRVMGAGARAFIPKDSAPDELVRAMRGVLVGETRVPPRLLTEVIEVLRRSREEQSEWQEKVDRLTEREREILELMVDGLDRAAIAERLFLSINTVRTHNKHILAKLDAHSSLEAVSIALRAGLRPEGDAPDVDSA